MRLITASAGRKSVLHKLTGKNLVDGAEGDALTEPAYGNEGSRSKTLTENVCITFLRTVK